MGALIDPKSWPCLPIFEWLQREGAIADAEMLRTFNCGIGMCVVVAESAVAGAMRSLQTHGETVHRIGRIERGPEGVRLA